MSKRFAFLSIIICLTFLQTFQNCGLTGDFSLIDSYVDWASVDSVEGNFDSHPLARKTEETSFQAPVGDRYFVLSVFQKVFGPTAINRTGNIHLRGSDLGGPCSLYEAIRYREGNSSFSAMRFNGQEFLGGVNSLCSSTTAETTRAEQLPSVTARREAWRMKACELLVLNDTTFNHALSQISKASLPEINEETLTEAFYLFYTGKPEPGEGILQSLEMLSEEPLHPTRDEWRLIIYTVCSSPYWQVI